MIVISIMHWSGYSLLQIRNHQNSIPGSVSALTENVQTIIGYKKMINDCAYNFISHVPKREIKIHVYFILF